MKSALNLFSVLRFKDVIEINYPNINILAVLPYNGKEEIIIKKIYKTIKKEIDKNCHFNEEVIKFYYSECR